MKKIVILTLLLIPFFSYAQTQKVINTSKIFFPKKEEIVKHLPSKNSVWVFILAGQSNMAGRGVVEPLDTLPDARIFTLNKNYEFVLAKEPLHFYEPSRTGLDCGLSFSKTLLENVPDSVSILLLPAAVGGSTSRQWLGDSIKRGVRLLTNFKKCVEIGKRNGIIKGILWHQGEGDANPGDIIMYEERITNLFKLFRQISENNSLPILIGELGTYSDNENWMKINKIIHSYVISDPNTAVIFTGDLKEKGDKEHFNSEGQRILGKRFANCFLNFLK